MSNRPHTTSLCGGRTRSAPSAFWCRATSLTWRWPDVAGAAYPYARVTDRYGQPARLCVAFGIAAVASYVVPANDAMVSVGLTNLFTSLGALCFLIGAVLLLPEGTQTPDKVVPAAT